MEICSLLKFFLVVKVDTKDVVYEDLMSAKKSSFAISQLN